MADPQFPSFPAHGLVSASQLNQRSQALLRECFGQFVGRLHNAVHISVHATNDLFDFNEHVSMREVADFRVRRDQWLLEYERTLRMLYVRRIGGTPRSGRRPDPESAPPTFHLLDPLDQEMQVALIRKVKDLQLATSVELVALSHRVAVLLGAKWRPDFDNPFDPQYVLDAIGSAARATYMAPYIWRALMQRVVVDINAGSGQDLHRSKPFPRRPERPAADQGGATNAQPASAVGRQRPASCIRTSDGGCAGRQCADTARRRNSDLPGRAIDSAHRFALVGLRARASRAHRGDASGGTRDQDAARAFA